MMRPLGDGTNESAVQKTEADRKQWHAPKLILSSVRDSKNGGDNVKTDFDAESAS